MDVNSFMMTHNQTSKTARAAGKPVPAVCLSSCQKLLEQVGQVKQALLDKYALVVNGQEGILQSALNEAEALAWQTPYPHLFFPVLAEEKLTAARRWVGRQELLRGSNWTRVLAA